MAFAKKSHASLTASAYSRFSRVFIAYNQTMRKPMRAFAGLALIGVMASFGIRGSASELLHQKRAVGGVAATVIVWPLAFGPSDFMIYAEFESSTYPVGCLSAYRDLRYELRFSDGRLIPADRQTLEHPPSEGPEVLNHVVAGSHGYACARNAVNGVWRPRAQFSALYPNLPPGKYTLRISFAPRGWEQHADFTPVPITIEPRPGGSEPKR
jgi:hypothetical protein